MKKIFKITGIILLFILAALGLAITLWAIINRYPNICNYPHPCPAVIIEIPLNRILIVSMFDLLIWALAIFSLWHYRKSYDEQGRF